MTLTQTEGEAPPQGVVYVGEAVDGAALLAEDNLPEVICARLGAPELKERGIGEEAHGWWVRAYIVGTPGDGIAWCPGRNAVQ